MLRNFIGRVLNMNDIHALYDLWCEKAVLDADLIEELNIEIYEKMRNLRI